MKSFGMTLTKLETLAKAATPGPWAPLNYYVYAKESPAIDVYNVEIACSSTDAMDVSHEVGTANAEYIAAADPETVLALIADLRRVREALDECAGIQIDFISVTHPYRAPVLRARAALDAMEVKL